MSAILDDEVRGWVCRRTPHDNHDDACDDDATDYNHSDDHDDTLHCIA